MKSVAPEVVVLCKKQRAIDHYNAADISIGGETEMRRMMIRRLGAWSVFKFSLVLYLIFFVITFIFLLLGYLIVMASGLAGAQGNEMAEAFKLIGVSGGVAMVILFFLGLFSCIFYALCNSVGALVYNLISWMTGGIELGLEEKEQQ